jgi:4'-phosphopantetheinyl transferase
MNRLLWHGRAAAEVPAGEDWLSPGERDRLRRFRFEKRRGDWLLGRFTAKQALLAAGEAGPLAALEIRAAPDGAPEAFRDGQALPRGLSLSHSRGRAVCLLGPSGAALGCDIETVESRSRAFVEDAFSEAERAQIPWEPVEAAFCVTLLWSAKESALKAVREGLRLPLSSVAVRIVRDASGEDGWRPLSIRGPLPVSRLEGWWRDAGGQLITVASAPGLGPPRRVV